MEVTIRKALQLKKKYAGELAKVRAQISSLNSQEETRVSSHWNVLDLYKEQTELVRKINSVKNAVAQKNAESGMYGKIIQADELRSQIAWVATLNTTEAGEKYDPKVREIVPVKYVVAINDAEKSKISKELTAQLEAVLDDIDFFNGSTKITVEI